MSAPICCDIALPQGFRTGDVLAFHRRDPQQLAERVDADTLHKGLAWGGQPACLTIRFAAQRAEVALAVDRGPTHRAWANGEADDAAALARLARRMLGLTQPVAAFERTHARHPQLGPLIARNAGLRVALAATPFEALSWAITGQQVSLGAAVSLRRRLIEAAGLRHSGGLACYPDARRLLQLGEDALRAAGLSQAKARALRALADAVEQGRLPLDAWAEDPPADEIRSCLLRIRGIGPWTVDYALLRGFGWVDGSLHGDAAVRRGLQALLGTEARPTEDEARRWLAPFSPWRALVAAHLWAMGAPA